MLVETAQSPQGGRQDRRQKSKMPASRLATTKCNPQAPVLGLPEGSGLQAPGCGCLASQFWRELELRVISTGGKGWLALVNHKNFKNDGTLRKGGKLPEATLGPATTTFKSNNVQPF